MELLGVFWLSGHTKFVTPFDFIYISKHILVLRFLYILYLLIWAENFQEKIEKFSVVEKNNCFFGGGGGSGACICVIARVS